LEGNTNVGQRYRNGRRRLTSVGVGREHRDRICDGRRDAGPHSTSDSKYDLVEKEMRLMKDVR